MSPSTEEFVRICEALPEDRQAEVADFARFLLNRLDDDQWERILADPRPRPKLEAFLLDAEQGISVPLDHSRL